MRKNGSFFSLSSFCFLLILFLKTCAETNTLLIRAERESEREKLGWKGRREKCVDFFHALYPKNLKALTIALLMSRKRTENAFLLSPRFPSPLPLVLPLPPFSPFLRLLISIAMPLIVFFYPSYIRHPIIYFSFLFSLSCFPSCLSLPLLPLSYLFVILIYSPLPFFLISNVSFLFIAYLSLLPSFYHICLALYLLTFLVVPVFLDSCYRLCLILPSSRDRLCLSLIFLLSRLSHSYLLLIIPIVSPLHSSHLVILMRFILPFNGMFLLHVEFLFLRSKFCRKYDLQAELFVQVVLCAMQGN